jgi:four helix bundle protein
MLLFFWTSPPEGLIPPHGGYRKLRSFQCAQQVYDATVIFCERFIEKRSRTHDQMVQAARSGVQNIAEGSMASATSKKTELKLTGVARASLEELLLDEETLKQVWLLRRMASMISSDSINFAEATERVIDRLRKSKSKRLFLHSSPAVRMD